MPAPDTAKPRPRQEWLMRLIQPLADRGVALLARRGADPQHVVLSHAVVGLAAAALLTRGPGAAWWAAAALLQVKTLLDNIDGGLARLTGRVTVMGRYLDTVMDLVVNVALFAALATLGPAGPAWLAFVLLSLLLSLDFTMEQRYRAARATLPPRAAAGPSLPAAHPAGAPRALLAVVRGVYRLVLAPQDRALAALDGALFRLASGTAQARAPQAWRLAWSDLFSTASLVNLGLSTQLLALGLLTAWGHPYLYVYWVYLQALYATAVQALRVWRLRRDARPEQAL